MTTVFGKVKFGSYAGPLGDKYLNQNINSPDQVVLAQWRKGELLNVWPKAFAGDGLRLPGTGAEVARDGHARSAARRPIASPGRRSDPVRCLPM